MTSADPPILPTVGDIIGAGKDRLIAVRPSVAPHLDSGEYAVLVTGLRGQFGLAARALAGLVRDSSLSTASGPALADLAASNFDTPSQPGATTAVGEVTFARAVAHPGLGPDWIQPRLAALPDATDQASFIGLIYNVSLVLTAADGSTHAGSLFVDSQGVGAHIAADLSDDPLSLWGLSTYGTYVASANIVKLAINRHLSNMRIADGTALAAHPTVDTANLVKLADATAATPLGAWGTQSAAETGALFALANACRSSLLAHLALLSKPGGIRAGLLIDRAAAPTATPPIPAAQYRVTRDYYVRSSSTSVDVPVEATRPGVTGNVPAWATSPPSLSLVARGALFDPLLLPTGLRAAGGGPGQDDAALTEAARAGWTGAYGPTPSALLAGSLRAAGAAKVVLREGGGRTWVYPVDASWSQSARWTASIDQVLRGTGADDEWLGLGCRSAIGVVVNRLVRVELVVQLRSADYLADTESITARVAEALKSYFDDRPDWWIYRPSAIRGLVSGVDRRRVLSCTFAVVRDSDGVPLQLPFEPAAGGVLTHWALESGAVNIDYVEP